jgi:hypothetical protein
MKISEETGIREESHYLKDKVDVEQHIALYDMQHLPQ